MMLEILSLIEVKIPHDLYFNDYGVCMRSLQCGGSLAKGDLVKGGKWKISIMYIGGAWYGAAECHYRLGGFSGPLCRYRPFPTTEECISYYHERITDYLQSNGCPVSKLPVVPSLEEFTARTR